MATRKHAPSNAPADLDPIAALGRAIVAAQEENWHVHGVSASEQARLRPIVAQQAKAVTDQLRAEHVARERAQR